MNLLLTKFKELENFEKRIFILNNKQYTVSLKPLNIKQMNFFLNEYPEISQKTNDKEFYEFFEELFSFENRDDSSFLLQNEETLNKLLEWIFKSYLYFNDFHNVFKKGVFKVEKETASDFTVFFKILVNYGYKVLELEKLNSKEIVSLALKEKKYRGSEEYYTFIKNIADLLHDDELVSFVQKELSELEENKKGIKKPKSDFDVLASL